MPEIKVKHVASFSSEDPVYKAENLLKAETYRKWKCATAGEKQASVILQFEKVSQIQSIDIGNEYSAFVEVLVGRSADSSNNYQTILAASSFMSPLESRNGNNISRVRMFGPERLAQNVKNEKWDTIQIVCTQPFNQNIQYGLSFVKFHSVPDPSAESVPEKKQNEVRLGGFRLKDDDDDSPLPVGNWFSKRNEKPVLPLTGPAAIRDASYASEILESGSSSPNASNIIPSSHGKRKLDDIASSTPRKQLPTKKREPTIAQVNRDKVSYKEVEKEETSKKMSPPRQTTKQTAVTPSTASAKQARTSSVEKKVKKKPFNKIMEKVVFVISGFQNPHRGNIRDRALEMGAQYKGDWDSSCTHLICAFVNTPKYLVVRGKGGRIVSKHWIDDCFKKKDLLPWRKYMLGTYSKSSTEDETDDDDEVVKKPKVLNVPKYTGLSKVNGILSSPSTSKTQTSSPIPNTGGAEEESPDKTIITNDDGEDDSAASDYEAATDVDDSSGGDTEDEIRKVEKKSKEQVSKSKSKISLAETKDYIFGNCNGHSLAGSTPAVSLEKPNADDLPLPILPDLFKKKKFFLYGDFSEKERHDLERYIIAYNGCLVDYMNENVKYVITLSKWNNDFDEALGEFEDLIFVRPQWIYNCHEKEKCVPFHNFIVIPNA